MGELVLVERRDDGVAVVTLNNPKVNALSQAMLGELQAIAEDLTVDPPGAVVITGGERFFAAGADISEFGTAPSYVEARRARRERDLWGFMLSLDKVLIAAIHGFALGAGVELPMCCDFRIASDEARLGLPEVTLGYIPSAGGTQTLPRHIPPGVAMQMVLTGDPIDAQAAYRYGLVQRAVPREWLYAEAEALARKLLSQPADAVRLAKRAVVEGIELPLKHGVALEWRLAAQSTAVR